MDRLFKNILPKNGKLKISIKNFLMIFSFFEYSPELTLYFKRK